MLGKRRPILWMVMSVSIVIDFASCLIHQDNLLKRLG